jgi:hypothetical protein
MRDNYMGVTLRTRQVLCPERRHCELGHPRMSTLQTGASAYNRTILLRFNSAFVLVCSIRYVECMRVCIRHV